MDTAQAITLAVTMSGFVSILTALFALMCQLNSRYSRLSAKLETAFGGLRSEIETSRGGLRSETRAMSVKVSEEELEKAWQEGVNSVLSLQTHTHDTPGD